MIDSDFTQLVLGFVVFQFITYGVKHFAVSFQEYFIFIILA